MESRTMWWKFERNCTPCLRPGAGSLERVSPDFSERQRGGLPGLKAKTEMLTKQKGGYRILRNLYSYQDLLTPRSDFSFIPVCLHASIKA